MTTHVPEGTTADEVAAMRTREAGRAAELAAQGVLLRLWRSPLRPGEWRTLGLFAALDADALNQNLVSMPLRAWRTDEVLGLAPHPNDPTPIPHINGAEFLVAMTVVVPSEVCDALADAAYTRESERARRLADEGSLSRLWSVGDGRTLGLWHARDELTLMAIIDQLPLRAWMKYEICSLSVHPSDPASSRTVR